MSIQIDDKAQEWYLERSGSNVSRLCRSPHRNERGGTKAGIFDSCISKYSKCVNTNNDQTLEMSSNS